jgi:erythromycin esterase
MLRIILAFCTVFPLFANSQAAGAPSARQKEKETTHHREEVFPEADLLAFQKAVGDQRVVVLAEQDHGDGTTLAAKSRLVKFLHQHMGFDVLLLEADHYALERLSRDGDPAALQKRRASVLPFWSATAETDSLWQYLTATQGSKKALAVNGFDNQLNSSFAREMLPGEALAIARSSGGIFTHQQTFLLFRETVDSLLKAAQPWRMAEEKKRLLFSCLDTLRRRFPSTGASKESRLVEMLTMKAEYVFFRNYRERHLARNLAWLLKERYPTQKVIVWTASFHGIKNMASLLARQPAAAKRYGEAVDKDTVESMVEILWRKHHLPTYVVNLVALSGSYTPAAWVSIHNAPLQITPPAGGVEEKVREKPDPSRFMDLKSLPLNHWLQEPLAMHPFLHTRTYQARWAEIFDAFFFINEMKPLTPLAR